LGASGAVERALSEVVITQVLAGYYEPGEDG